MVNFDTFWVRKAFNLQKKLLNDLENLTLILVSILPFLDATISANCKVQNLSILFCVMVSDLR